MKNFLFVLLLAAVALPSCTQNRAAAVDIPALQQKLNLDPDLAKVRTVFQEHCATLASIPSDQLDAIFAKTRDCGFYAADAALPELEKCLAAQPGGDQYVKAEKMRREYQQYRKEMEQRYPELAELTPADRSALLVPVSEAQAEAALSSYLLSKK